MDGNLTMEGNPIMRGMMAALGPTWGLVTEKLAIFGMCLAIAIFYGHAIQEQKPWIYKIPSTKWARQWMRAGDRSWIALVPLYVIAISQGLAAVSWIVLEITYR